MKQTSRPALVPVVSFVGLVLAGCGGNGNAPLGVTTVNPVAGKLQVAVGTANIYGDLGAAGALTGLNVVETFRQQSGAQTTGDSAALVNTPRLTGPMTLPGTVGTPDAAFGATFATGPSSTEIGGNAITATPQQTAGSTTIPPTTFGVSGNASGFGIEDFNYTTSGTASNAAGTPASYMPYPVPGYDPNATDLNAFTPWGGPPAYDPNKDGKGTRDGTGFPRGVLGVSLGLDVFAGVTPGVGTYTLAVSVPTGQATTGNVTATAALATAALLPLIMPAAPTLDGGGGGTFAIVLPAGVTDGYVQITDIGPAAGTSCNGSAPPATGSPAYYTLHVTASGTATLPDTDGPAASTSVQVPSICTAAQNTALAANAGMTVSGDEFTVQSIGFDYSHFAAAYPQSNGNAAPTITGANGQADITISSAALYTSAATGAVPAVASAGTPRTSMVFTRH